MNNQLLLRYVSLSVSSKGARINTRLTLAFLKALGIHVVDNQEDGVTSRNYGEIFSNPTWDKLEYALAGRVYRKMRMENSTTYKILQEMSVKTNAQVSALLRNLMGLTLSSMEIRERNLNGVHLSAIEEPSAPNKEKKVEASPRTTKAKQGSFVYRACGFKGIEVQLVTSSARGRVRTLTACGAESSALYSTTSLEEAYNEARKDIEEALQDLDEYYEYLQGLTKADFRDQARANVKGDERMDD